MLQQWTVYQGVRGDFPPVIRAELAAQTWQESVRRFPDHPSQHVIIPDNVAQCIASWWHSPARPYSTVLSTMGRVDRYMTLSDFGDPEKAETTEDAMCLRALGAYIEHHISMAESAARECACNECFSSVVGVVGDVCSACEEWGCDPTDTRSECEVPFDDTDPDTDCTDPECPGCLYCIPGA